MSHEDATKIAVEKHPVKNSWKGRGGFMPVAIVEHMMQGSLEETWQYFDGKGEEGNWAVSAHYGIGREGQVWQFVADEDTAWANGVLQNPDTEIGWLKEVAEEGVNCNLVTLAIEYEGFSGEPLSDAQYRAALELHRQLAQRWDIEIDSEHIIGHDRLDSVERANNPGSAFPLLQLLRDLAETVPAKASAAEATFSAPASEPDKVVPFSFVEESERPEPAQASPTGSSAPLSAFAPDDQEGASPAVDEPLLPVTPPSAEPGQPQQATSLADNTPALPFVADIFATAEGASATTETEAGPGQADEGAILALGDLPDFLLDDIEAEPSGSPEIVPFQVAPEPEHFAPLAPDAPPPPPDFAFQEVEKEMFVFPVDDASSEPASAAGSAGGTAAPSLSDFELETATDFDSDLINNLGEPPAILEPDNLKAESLSSIPSPSAYPFDLGAEAEKEPEAANFNYPFELPDVAAEEQAAKLADNPYEFTSGLGANPVLSGVPEPISSYPFELPPLESTRAVDNSDPASSYPFELRVPEPASPPFSVASAPVPSAEVSSPPVKADTSGISGNQLMDFLQDDPSTGALSGWMPTKEEPTSGRGAGADLPPAQVTPNQGWHEDMFGGLDLPNLPDLPPSSSSPSFSPSPASNAPVGTHLDDSEAGALEPSETEVANFERLIAESGAAKPPPTSAPLETAPRPQETKPETAKPFATPSPDSGSLDLMPGNFIKESELGFLFDDDVPPVFNLTPTPPSTQERSQPVVTSGWNDAPLILDDLDFNAPGQSAFAAPSGWPSSQPQMPPPEITSQESSGRPALPVTARLNTPSSPAPAVPEQSVAQPAPSPAQASIQVEPSAESVAPAPPSAPAPTLAPSEDQPENTTDQQGIHWVGLGGGVISVEYANVRNRPSYESDSIMKVAELGQRQHFDGWAEGPELRGSTRWYHITQGDGGGWIHSTLVQLDQPFKAE